MLAAPCSHIHTHTHTRQARSGHAPCVGIDNDPNPRQQTHQRECGCCRLLPRAAAPVVQQIPTNHCHQQGGQHCPLPPRSPHSRRTSAGCCVRSGCRQRSRCSSSRVLDDRPRSTELVAALASPTWKWYNGPFRLRSIAIYSCTIVQCGWAL